MDQKSEFISIATHQLRMPLVAIKWAIKMILDGDAGKLTAEQRELLNKCYLSNEKIISLVDNILNVSRIKDGRLKFNFAKTDFQEVIDEAVGATESFLVNKHQELIIQKPEKLPKVYLDKGKMIMVMQDLLDNAIKYSPEHGKIKIIIQVNKLFLYVKINNQGAGIPKKDQPKIFSKFFRATNAVKAKINGSGLGLFIVKNVIKKHNGKISLKSEEGKGVEINFSIPINKF